MAVSKRGFAWVFVIGIGFHAPALAQQPSAEWITPDLSGLTMNVSTRVNGLGGTCDEGHCGRGCPLQFLCSTFEPAAIVPGGTCVLLPSPLVVQTGDGAQVFATAFADVGAVVGNSELIIYSKNEIEWVCVNEPLQYGVGVSETNIILSKPFRVCEVDGNGEMLVHVEMVGDTSCDIEDGEIADVRVRIEDSQQQPVVSVRVSLAPTNGAPNPKDTLMFPAKVGDRFTVIIDPPTPGAPDCIESIPGGEVVRHFQAKQVGCWGKCFGNTEGRRGGIPEHGTCSVDLLGQCPPSNPTFGLIDH